MGMRPLKPVTPGQRGAILPTFGEITKDRPEKHLLRPLRKTGGRNHSGHITARRRAGGHKRNYRLIDFRRDKFGIKGRVLAVEYDPNRSARLALIGYEDGERRYILWPHDLRVGDEVVSSPEAEVKVGNTLPLQRIPLGTLVHNVDLMKGRGGQIVRSAGASAQIMAKEGDNAHLRLPSGEVRLVGLSCLATIGQVGNVDHEGMAYGKAGRRRWLGRKPTVRGLAMNPVDHPHGGGEGRTLIGRRRGPATPWGKPARGVRTRKKKKKSNTFILSRLKK